MGSVLAPAVAFSIKQKIALVGLYSVHQKNVTKGVSKEYVTNRTWKEFYCQLNVSDIIRDVPNFLERISDRSIRVT